MGEGYSSTFGDVIINNTVCSWMPCKAQTLLQLYGLSSHICDTKSLIRHSSPQNNELLECPTSIRSEHSRDVKEAMWAKISTTALFPQGKECTSPSPYDFCNSRSDGDEYDSSKETELVGFQEQSTTSGESYEDGGNGIETSAEAEFRDENYLNSSLTQSASILREEYTHHNKNEHENGITRTPLGGSQNTRIVARKSGSLEDFEGTEESTGMRDFEGTEESTGRTSVSSVFQDFVQGRREEPVDIEKDKRIWEIPGPANEDDERGSSLRDDDDEFETGSPTKSGSGGGLGNNDDEFKTVNLIRSDSRGRERESSKEQRIIATQAVVDSHYRALIVHLLNEEGIETDKESWLEIVADLSWRAACLVKPDKSECGMDPGAYVKVKCVATGRPMDSSIVKGVVCKKNVANRRMTSSYEKPRLLLLGGALEYQRDSDPLSSIDAILTLEEEHLKQTMTELAEHHPNVLLVEKTVTRFAHEWLVGKDISLVLNMKRPLLERIARCTGGQIIPSLNKVKSAVTGYCKKFWVEKYTEEHGSAGQAGKKLSKYLMFFDGGLKRLGCTVLLKGANGDELKKVKHVVQLAVFAAYHVALETAFLADEGALHQNVVYPLRSPLILALPDAHRLKLDRSIAMIPGFSDSVHMYNLQNYNNEQILALPASSWSEGSISPSTVLSTDGKSPSPMQGYGFQLQEPPVGGSTIEPSTSESDDKNAMNNSSLTEGKKVESVDGLLQVASKESRKQDDFPPSPSDHQNIVVSYSSSCLRKAKVCEIGRLLRIKYYGSSDEPLGDFLCFKLLDPKSRCGICDEPTHDHVLCYTHRLGSLSISVRHQDQVLPGVTEHKIWMWHRCLKCPLKDGVPPMTRRVVMSKAAWGLSFGKFLELSFSSHAAASRVATCGHLLHRDCLRFFGCGNVLAYFKYAPSNLYSVCLPPVKLEFHHPKLQGWLIEEVNKVTDKGNSCFADALNDLNKFRTIDMAGGSGMVPAETRKHIAELEALLQKEKAEFEGELKKVEFGKAGVDMLEWNRFKLALVTCSIEWTRRIEKLKTDLSVASISKRSLNDSAAEVHDSLSNNAHDEGKEDSSVSLIKSKSSERRSLSYPGVTRQINVHTSDGILSNSPENPLAHTAYDEAEDSHLSHSDSSQGDACNTLTRSSSNSLTNLEDNSTRSDDEEKPLDIYVSSEDTSSVEMSSAFSLTEGRLPLLEEEVLKENSTVEANLQIALIGESHPDMNGNSSDRGHNGAVESICRVSSGSSISSRLKGVDEDDSRSSTFSNFYRTYSSVGSMDYLSRSPPVVSSIEIEVSGRVLLPLGENDTVVAIYDDEPTSIIAYALTSQQYQAHLSDNWSEKEKSNSKVKESKDEEKEQQGGPLDVVDSISHSMVIKEGNSDRSDCAIQENHNSIGLDKAGSFLTVKDDTASTLLNPSDDIHAKLSFLENGILKYGVTCYFARQFDALQKKCCPNDLDFIRSLCRCKKWGAQGGKSNVFFAKTSDDRFVVKQVTKTELESFISFAPLYFKYLSEALNTGSPTCLAKILGIFRVSVKHGKGGKDSSMDLLVMENLFYGRDVTRIYDLKGSVRSRYNADATGQNKVLLDQNFIELRQRNPLFVSNKAKRLLERAVWNDTAFLASVDVMDYSLVVGIDKDSHELVLGIIDFIRQYTWDKHLETWVKSSGILGGPKNVRPTVISPKDYKTRFRKAMTNYFLVIPNQWDTPLTTLTPGQGFVPHLDSVI